MSAFMTHCDKLCRMVSSQLATRSTRLTENGETNCLSEHVQRGCFTSVAQPTYFALIGLIGLFPGLFHRNVTFQTAILSERGMKD